MRSPWAGEGEWDDELQSPDGDDEEPTSPCPYCRREIHEQSPRCPYCGQYISREDAPASRKPWWLIAGVVLCLFVVYLWITGR
jgi:hypothetical protein